MVDTHQLKLISVLAALLFTSFVIAGCEGKTSTRSADPSQKAPHENPGAFESPANPKSTSTEPGGETTTNTIDLVLYFGDDQSEKLVKEVRAVAATDARARAAVDELINGPSDGGTAVIPAGTRLLGVNIENRVADVNFSRDFVDNHPGGSAAERLTAYSIVNTLTEFSTIDEVRFLVEGQNIETIAGHLDTSQPVKRDESLL